MFANMLDLVSSDMYLFVTFLVISSVIIYFVFPSRRNMNLPPGPPSYPVIGNILGMKNKEIGSFFEQCRRDYGDVFSLKVFGTILIIISGSDVIREAFVRKSHLFSDRPKVPLLSQFRGNGIVMASGHIWKTNRRFSLRTLRDFGMGRNVLQIKIHEEIEAVLSEIEKFQGKPFDIKSLLNYAVTNIIFSLLFGKRCSYDDTKLNAYVRNSTIFIASSNLFFIPTFCKYIPGDPLGARNVNKSLKESYQLHSDMIDEHIETYDENNIRDYIDAYIKEFRATTPEGNTAFDKEELISIIGGLFSAGSETTATALKWGIIYMMRDQEMQTRLSEELLENIPNNRLPNMDDKSSLLLVCATVMEILRVGNILPLSVPHAVTRDCTFRGFTIPKEAFVFPNLQSVMFDEEAWKNPKLFQPDRFLAEDSIVNKNEYFIPFSVGRRSCLGESLAKMELFLFFSALIRRFQLLPLEGEDQPGLDYVFGVTRAPKPFMMRAIKRQW